MASRTSALRLVVVVAVAALVAGACTRTPPGGELVVGLTPGEAAPRHGGLDLSDPELGWTESDASLDETGVSSGVSTAGGARSTAHPAEVQSGPTPARTASSVSGSGPGVNGRTVKVVFHHQLESCGGSNDATMNEKGRQAINDYVRWYNEEVLASVGWQIEYEIVDDGGPDCPEKAQATALKIAREIKPFAVLGDVVTNARGPVLQDLVTRAGIIHIGTNFQTYESIAVREPYAKPTLAVAETAIRDLLGWIEVRVKGTPTANPTTGVAEDRVYGILGVETPDGRILTKIANDEVRAMGITPAGVYQISGDVGVAAQQGTNLALRMRQDGVNTVVWALPYTSIFASMAMTEAMNAQNYLPEILVGTMGIAFFDQLHNSRAWANARGISQAPALLLRTAITADLQEDPRFKDLVENADAYIRVWHRLGHNDNPQDGSVPGASSTFQNLGQLATGILHLPGDVLNAETFSQGLESARRGQRNRCTVARFMGRDYEYMPTWDWRGGPPYGAKGFTTVYWVNRPTPPFATGLYESYDNYRFFESPADLPPEPSRDTGRDGFDIPKQQFIGLFPWSDCSQWPDYR